MTEYEMAYLNNEFLITGIMLATAQFSVMSAFLVAGYLAAHRLNLIMAGFVNLAFLWSSFTLSMTLYRLIIDFIGLRHEIFVAAKNGKAIAWHSAAQFDTAAFASAPVAPIIWFMLSLGAVYFFFHSRRVNLKAETTLTVPGPVATSP